MSDDDIESLEDKRWMTCTAVSIFMTLCEDRQEEIIKKNKVLMIRPEFAQMFKFGGRKTVKDLKEQLKTKESNWVFFPVNNRTDEMEGDGGRHWSLLIYSKKADKYFHFDPLEGVNVDHAKDLILNSLDRDNFNENGYFRILYDEAMCGSQYNGYDCGPFMMHYMEMALNKIEEGKANEFGFGEMYPEEWRALDTRKTLRLYIEKEINNKNIGNGINMETVTNETTDNTKERIDSQGGGRRDQRYGINHNTSM